MAETTAITDALGEYSGRYAAMAAVFGQDAADLNQSLANSMWLNACNQADSYCQNDFDDIESARDPFGVALPAQVQNGVVGLACYYYLRRVFSLTGETVGDITETFADATFDADMERHFGAYRENPGL